MCIRDRVSQSPFFGGRVVSYDEKKAKSMKGVVDVVPIPNGIAVVADSSWHAQKGLEATNVQFEGGKTHDLGTEKLQDIFTSSLDEMGRKEVEGKKTLDLEYEIQFLSHAAICLLYTSPSPRDATLSRMPSSA